MAASKSALKAIKAAIDAGDFEKATKEAKDLVAQDGKNYNALMFLGFAEEKQNHNDNAEKALLSALSVKREDVQAYKGLITLYEKQASAKLNQYHDIVHRLAKVYADQEDREQCQTVIDKYELFAKKHGTQQQYRTALELILPTSDLYSILEGRVLKPSLAYQRILESSEVEEQEWIAAQIAERRTRLGARIDQVTKDVKAEAVLKFQIEPKLQAVIDWTVDDNERHELEEKLLQRAYDDLKIVPQEMKASQRDKVLNTANGMVIIRHQFPLAWNIALEWVDADDLGDWDVNILREYIDFFPDQGLAKVLRGWLDSDASPFSRPVIDPGDSSAPERLTEADQLITMVEGMEDAQSSMLAHRIMSHTYLALQEHQSAVDVARKGQKLYLQAQTRFALDLQNSIDAVNLILANALITYQSPRHHPEARALFQDILDRKPKLTAALLGIGLILEEDEDFSEAVKFLKQALDRDPSNIRIQLEYAWCYAMDDNLRAGLDELEQVLEQVNLEKNPSLEMKSETLYRIAYCMWNINKSSTARKDKNGPYRYLIDSVKANPSYAPAYTLLGIYFQDYGKSKQRARVALQKAFELSTSELIAAERLANAFAKSGEWDLVELVAQRVVDSGKARPAPGSKKKAVSWPFAALGVVQMNRQQYSQSIVSFQAALRINPQDYHSWVGLGESYHNSGRYVAASKAFNKAESIEHGLSPEESWFAKYMLANVQREVGAFDDAISAYEAVLKIKPDEYGVLLALLQTCSENAWAKIAQGLFGRAAVLSNKAIGVAQQLVKQKNDAFNLWKSVADACSAIGHCKMFADSIDMAEISNLLRDGAADESYEVLAEVDKVDLDSLKSDTNQAERFLSAAVLANKRAIRVSAHDTYAQAVAWYNLGWSEQQAYLSSNAQSSDKSRKSTRFLKAAVRCFKRAIELEAGNSDFWNALGVVTINLNPKISQHSLVRSLHLNDHSARTWTNLGALFLINDDIELANEAFTKAQSSDPEYADAWIGQGLIAVSLGKIRDAHGLFTHAFEIADSSLMAPKRHYSSSAFDHLIQDKHVSEDVVALLQPLFALRQLHAQQPSDIITSHLQSLFAERVDDFDSASKVLIDVCSAAEAEYEKSESNDYLVRYAQAKADLARIQLGNGEYESAIENAETAIDLSEEDVGAVYSSQREKWRLSAHITAGLAHSRVESTDQAIKMFQIALEESEHSPDIVCMLSQVLWAKGGKAEKDAARAQLFSCVENNPEHVRAVSLLAVVGLLDADEDVIEAVEDDLKAFRVSDRANVVDKMAVSKILAAIISCGNEGSPAIPEATTADALQSVMLSPAQPQGWIELAQVTSDAHAAEMALVNAVNQIPPNGTLDANTLARAYAGTKQSDSAQMAMMLAPWSHRPLEASKG